MRLSKLEIKGFKSFANDTVIHFNEAVTGIVGPNGSGKSNIVDAIRWVLGEQKGRELRLEQMSDVIFNGTKRKKEAPMASVTISFENTRNLLPIEYSQVDISRILYRSGESEYRINQVPCRLKDITSMFLDTGIGADSYAIIALGMVEDLLSNKESARRKMFEQAAGISKYKSRKRESINKLKATTEDLARIEDLLFEINNNLVELEKQAKRAKKFYEMRDKYRNTGLKLAAITVNSLREKIAATSQLIDSEIVKLSDREAALHLAEAETEQYKMEHLSREKNLGEYQKKVNELLDQIRNIESEIQVNSQKNWFIDSQISQIQQNLTESNSKNDVLVQELILLNSEVEKTKQEFLSNEAESKKFQEILEIKQLRFDELKFTNDQDQLRKIEFEKSIFELEKQIAVETNQTESLEKDIERTINENIEKLEQLDKLKKELQVVEEKYNNLLLKINDIREDEEKRKLKLSEIQTLIETQNSVALDKKRLRDSKRNEFELLKSMIDKMEGFPESSVFLSQNWRKDVPILLDLIYTEEKYRPAIEFYLEPYLNYHVVKSEDEAIQAIKLLYGNAKGKANFFILGKISNDKSSFGKQLPGCKAAIDLIETDNVYRSLFNQLLHNVFIIDSEGGLEEIHKYPDDHIVISLSGSVLKSKNVITGGSVGLFEGKKLGRKKNLEKLESEIVSIDSEIFEMEQKLSDLKNAFKKLELETKETELAALLKDENSLLQQITQLKTQLSYFSELISQNQTKIANYKSKIDELNQSRSLRSIDLNLVSSQLNDLIGIINQSDQIFVQVSTELSSANAIYNQSKLEVLKWENKLDSIHKDFDYKSKQKEELLNHIQTSQNKFKDLTAEKVEIDTNLEQLKSKLEERYEFKKSLEIDLGLMEREYLEIRNTISTKESNVKDIQKSIFELQSAINQTKEERTNLNYKIESTLERAELEFNLKIEAYVAEDETEQMTEEQLRDRVQYYKVRLDNYGEINPLALEAYEEMKSRFDAITEQRSDILAAQDSLLQTIKEIEQTATESFLNAFHQVRSHFQVVFRSLFTQDDDCDLILLDEMDPLECDIDIIAKPKGKRPKSIHQLSGGEKTLTAIALLFSLYLLKPAPFCIFDEVDAPLDDINIDKFNHIIRKFSKDSQFVIITHNKLTMAEVDVLYGVYMEEQGVSNVTSVDFRTYSHDVILSEMEG